MRINRAIAQRGQILRVLEENRGIEVAVDFTVLLRTLDTLGASLSAHDLRDCLRYLADKGYVALTRWRDLAAFRPDRLPRGGLRPDDIVSVKLSPAGLDLVQGSIPADPGISF